MKINKITNNINFRENSSSLKINSENAILMLREPKAAVRFQHSQEFARKADSADSNPLVALGYKLYRTFNKIVATDDVDNSEKQLDTVA